MISLLTGKIIEKKTDSIIVDVNGVGYEVQVSSRTLAGTESDSMISINTYLHVREDAMVLYGFTSLEEKELFLTLLKITGIGPRLALAIQSISEPQELKRKILEGDADYFEMVPGVGSRMANRIIVELQGKVAIDKLEGTKAMTPGQEQTITSDAIKALLSLGYARTQAQKMAQSVIRSKGDKITIEEFLKHALGKENVK